jgi:site-specific DNA-methyltransferase (adenine-specific)
VVLDESQAEALDQMSGDHPSRPGKVGSGKGIAENASSYGHGGTVTSGYRDIEAGASRFFYVAKADSAERPRINGVAHPTVKPLALMRWLVRLVTPPGGTVLEPFAGSGTTVEACLLEGFKCIAIEREQDYLPLIVSRLAQGVLDFGQEPA